ncbi:MAG: phosphoglycerate kinase [Acidobacteriota bacterium]
MQLQILGAAGEVTGSCYLIESGGRRVLLECGLKQGSRSDEQANRADFPFDPKSIDAVVLSHAHIDHSGRLPLLVQRGYRGPIYCHRATRDLCRVMLRDAAFLNEKEAGWENRKRERKGLDLVEPLYSMVDALILGGGMANTFLAAQGHDMADSLVEVDKIAIASRILEEASRSDIQVLLPVDLVVVESLERIETAKTVPADSIPAATMAVDIGPTSREIAAAQISKCQTVLWNGPMGVFETPPFDAGTLAIADAMAGCPGYTVIGGGETVAAAKAADVIDRLGHVSTGGGASLEFLAGETLPGIAALEKSP